MSEETREPERVPRRPDEKGKDKEKDKYEIWWLRKGLERSGAGRGTRHFEPGPGR